MKCLFGVGKTTNGDDVYNLGFDMFLPRHKSAFGQSQKQEKEKEYIYHLFHLTPSSSSFVSKWQDIKFLLLFIAFYLIYCFVVFAHCHLSVRLKIMRKVL